MLCRRICILYFFSLLDAVPCIFQPQRSERVRGIRSFPRARVGRSVFSALPPEQTLHCDPSLWTHQVSAPAGKRAHWQEHTEKENAKYIQVQYIQVL